VAIIAAGVRILYCHSELPLTSGKLCFIINFIGGTGGPEFLLGLAAAPCPLPPLNRPCDADIPHHLAGDQQAFIIRTSAATTKTTVKTLARTVSGEMSP